MTLEEFKNKHLGKQVEFHSYGGGALNQCVDLVNAYINQVLDGSTKDYTEIIGTNAKDFSTKYDQEDFEWIANTPTGVPEAGDIVVWNGNVGGGAGHVAIILEGNTRSFKSLDQNWSQKEKVTLESHNYTNVTGWLRYKKTTPSDEYGNMVKKSNQWDETCAHYNLGDPNHTMFERLRNYISGIQSNQTACNNNLKEKTVELEMAKTEVLNRTEQVGRLKDEVTEASKREDALISQLKKAETGTAETVKVYIGQIEGLKSQVNEVSIKLGNANNEAAKWKAKYETEIKTPPTYKNFIDTITDSIIKVISAIKTK